ncbi:hypothetical protein Golomagni_00622 [Golovinomyces magnicellulatus]|nr:hypothetical protein Golomagni_00622 [Golovinomyces magnicellulatus]
MCEPDTLEDRIISLSTPNGKLQADFPTHLSPLKHEALNNLAFPNQIDIDGKHQYIKESTIENHPNRSARKKSVRTLIERTLLGNISEEIEDIEDLADDIYDSDDKNNPEYDTRDPTNLIIPKAPKNLNTKEKIKHTRRLEVESEPLTAYESYFNSNKGGYTSTSNNTLSLLELLDHEEYFNRYANLENHNENDLKDLEQLHFDKFNQWQFELAQNFNLCLYGFGSKRSLLMQFADYLHQTQKNNEKFKIVVVNGYVNNLTVRDIFKTVASAITGDILKFGSPADMLGTIFSLLDEDKHLDITIIIHSIDGRALRRISNQNILARLSSHSQIHLVTSADHPSFPLLWDSSIRCFYNFLFYDCTTYRAYNIEFDVVKEVHDILGRRGRRAGGKEGVTFVLKSLPENAKKLFGLLIREQLKSMADNLNTNERSGDNVSLRPNECENDFGIEYRILYQKSVEEFICSNEINFRTLLKEFNDHEMIQSKKDALGAELLTIPLCKEELEVILEDTNL